VSFGQGPDEHPIASLAILAGAEIVRVLEIDRVDRTFGDEGVDYRAWLKGTNGT
jgi:hypothetical protein